MAKRLRILFINCPSLAVDAAAFLVLSQNAAQSAIQFEVEHFWIYGETLRPPKMKIMDKIFAFNEKDFHSFAQWLWPLSSWFEPVSRWLERKNRTRLDLYGAPQFGEPFKMSESLTKARTAIESYDKWFASSNWTKWFPPNAVGSLPTIVVTETALVGRYLGNSQGNIGLISAAKWEDFFRPDSGLEYVLNSVQRFSLRMLYGSKLGTHYPSRACMWDFHVHQPDARISSHVGFLCETCQGLLKQETSPSEFSELMSLIKNAWVGAETDSSSVAGILRKNYRYSLSRSSGLHQDAFDGVSDAMKSEFGKLLIEVVKWSLIVLITLLFLTYFPDVTKKWKDFMSSSPQNKSTITATPEPIQSPTPKPELTIPASRVQSSSPE